MQKTWKKALALALALCAVLGLMVPMAGSADATEETSTSVLDQYFGENGTGYGPATHLGDIMKGELTAGYYSETLTYDGKEYALTLSKGGFLYVFCITDFVNDPTDTGAHIYDMQTLKTHEPQYIAVDSNNIAYISDGSAISVYDISKKELKLQQITGLPGAATTLVTDKDNNLYVSMNDGYVCKVVYDKDTGSYSIPWTNDYSEIVKDMRGIACDGEYVYVCGGEKTEEENSGSYMFKINTSGKEEARVFHSFSGPLIYLSCVGGVLFGGNTTGMNHMVTLDTDTLEQITIGMTLKNDTELVDGNFEDSAGNSIPAQDIYNTASVVGLVVVSPDGTSARFVLNDHLNQPSGYPTMKGVWEYDIENKTAKQINNTNGRGYRCRDPFVTLGTDESTGTYLYNHYNDGSSLGYYSGTAGLAPATFADDFWSGAISQTDIRHIGTGVAEGGPAVYVGGYRSARAAGFDPSAEVPMNGMIFSHGASQFDASVVYDKKIYGGLYTTASIFRYDPVTGEVTKDLTEGRLDALGQDRIHTLAAGDNKIFFATIPEGQQKGCYLGYFDLEGFGEDDDTRTLEDRLVIWTNENKEKTIEDQVVISLVYDEDKKVLYAATSRRGGANYTADTTQEAYIKVFDVENWDAQSEVEEKKNWQNPDTFSVRSSVNNNSNMEFADEIPWYIDGIAKDPYTKGKFWGVVSRSIFTFSYDEENHTMVIDEQLDDDKDIYTNKSSLSWFPRPICFSQQTVGNETYTYMYVYRAQSELYRYTVTDEGLTGKVKIDTGTRYYAMGTDGNLYTGHTWGLYRISLNRVSVVEDLIYAANDEASVATAEAAYNELSAEEKAQVGPYYTKKLGVEEAECYYLDASSNERIETTLEDAMAKAGNGNTVYLLADYEGDIVVDKDMTLDLMGKTVDGNVSVGPLGGVVTDSTVGAGTITGELDLALATSLPKMPLQEIGTGNYHLYDYEAKLYTAAKDSENSEQLNFWFDLEITDEHGLQLMTQGTQDHIDIEATLTVDTVDASNALSLTKEWSDTTIQICAINRYNDVQDGNYAFYLGVTGITDKITYLHVKPTFEVCGYTGKFLNSAEEDELSADVRPLTVEAFFAPWLNSSVNE